MAAPFELLCDAAFGAGPLDVVGDVRLVLDGTSGANASTPDHASLDITGDLDVRFEGDIDNWGQVPFPALFAKWTAAGDQRSYIMWISGATLVISWSTDGTFANAFTMNADQQLPVTSGRLAVRATLDVDNGASGRTATFYTATTIAGPWTQLGDPVTASGTTSVFSGSAVLQVGNVSASEASNPLVGRVIAAEVLDSIGGTAVANPDFSAQSPGAASFADATAKTWTLGGTAELVGSEWSSLSDDLSEAAWSYGRDDELEHHSPGTGTVRLKNDDRSYDPDHATGPHFGDLLPRVPVRLRSRWSALDLPGTVGATASTADHASLTVTDLDVRVHLAMDDWTPGGFGQRIVDQDGGAGDVGWVVVMVPAGTPQFVFTTDGTTALTRTATAATGFADGSDHWLRVTLDADDGAGNHDVTFYTSIDGVIWAQLGAVVQTAGTVSPYDSTAPIRVGGAVTELAGQVRYVEVRSAIDGTVVANPDFMSVPPGATSFRDGTGKTWTVNGTAAVAVDPAHVLDEFYGFVGDDGWRQELSPPAKGDCVLQLVDLLAVLAGGYKLPDVFDHAVVGRSPVGYWVLDSPGGSESVGDLSGNSLDGTVSGDVQFGQAPIAAGHTSSAFFDGDADRIDITRSQIVSDVLNATVVATFSAQSVPSLTLRLLYAQINGNNLATTTASQLYVDNSGNLAYLRIVAGGGITYDAGPVVGGDGHIAFGQGDGIAVDTATLTTATVVGVIEIANGVGIGGIGGIPPADHWHGRIGAVAVYDRNLTQVERQLILDGYGKLAGLRSDEHISWALDRIGVPPELRNLDEGTVLMGPAATGGRDALEWVREVTATEQGELFVDHRDGGKLRFVNRYARFLNARSTAAQEVFSDDPALSNVVRVERGDLDLVPSNAVDLVNQATVAWRDGEEIVEDATSRVQFGPRPRQLYTQATTATQARSAGEWLVARYKDPKSRVKGVGVDASAARIGFRAVRHLHVGDRVTNRLHPQQVGSASTHNLFVEKAAHAVSGVRWHTAWRTSSVDTFTPWILGVSLLGQTTFAG